MRSMMPFLVLSALVMSMTMLALAAEKPRTRPRPRPKPGGPIRWVVRSRKVLPTGVRHETFSSKAMKKRVGYHIYTPPGYETSRKRYPVIYWLHGIRGNETKGLNLPPLLHAAIAAKKVPPMILVLPNGGQFTFYCDSADGKILAETAIVKELIPHIDKQYRTVATRDGRAVEGFSMGGFGALHLAFKYPELFCSVAAGGAGLITPDDMANGHPEMFRMMYKADRKTYAAETPEQLLRKNAEKIRRDLQIYLFVGKKGFFFADNERLRKLLTKQRIRHEYRAMEGLGHQRIALYKLLADEIFQFHAQRFSRKAPASKPSSK